MQCNWTRCRGGGCKKNKKKNESLHLFVLLNVVLCVAQRFLGKLFESVFRSALQSPHLFMFVFYSISFMVLFVPYWISAAVSISVAWLLCGTIELKACGSWIGFDIVSKRAERKSKFQFFFSVSIPWNRRVCLRWIHWISLGQTWTCVCYHLARSQI